MKDYMRALLDRFYEDSPETIRIDAEINREHRDLSSKLQKAERKQLLRIIDLANARKEASTLSSFITGYRLAWGIHRELTDDPPYSFAHEEEQRARTSERS